MSRNGPGVNSLYDGTVLTPNLPKLQPMMHYVVAPPNCVCVVVWSLWRGPSNRGLSDNGWAGRRQMDSFCGQTIIAGPCLWYWVTNFFPPLPVCVRAGKGRWVVGMNTQEYEARACWSMRRKAGTYEYVAASRREEVLSGGGGRPRGKWCEKLQRRVLLSVSTPCSVLTPLFF